MEDPLDPLQHRMRRWVLLSVKPLLRTILAKLRIQTLPLSAY